MGALSHRRRPRPITPVDADVAALGPALRRRVLAWRRSTGPDVALVLELIARELRSGVTLADALSSIDEDVDPGLAALRHRTRAGAALADELERWTIGLGPDDGPLVRGVLGLGLSTGAALADALDRTAAVLRERDALTDELRSLTAQSRASAILIAVVPVGLLLVLGLADPAGLAVLTATPLGWVCLTAGAALDGLGFWWMQRLVAGVTA